MAAIYGVDEGSVDDSAGPTVPHGAAPLLDITALHREHFLHLTRLAAMLVGDRETAEDVVQDVFAAMQQRWRMFTTTEQALRYVRSSVINRARTVLRRRRSAARHRPDTPIDETPAEQAALANLRDEAVRRALDGLPHRQREILLLRYLEDLSVAETAGVLGISSAAVKSSAGRALRSLTTMLGDDHDH